MRPPKPSKEELIRDFTEEYLELQDKSCVCHLGFPPCTYCIEGGSLPKEEYIQLKLDEED